MQSTRGLLIRAGLVLVLAVVVGAGVTASASGPQTRTTGAGVMANIHGGLFTPQGGQLYQFDSNRAATFFDNSFSGVVECVDNTGLACDIAGAPPVPAPDPVQAVQSAESQACAFRSGGSLQPTSYLQTILITTNPTLLSYKAYTYHYDVAPNLGTVGSLTAWNVLNPQSTAITVQGEIADEEVTMLAPSVPSYAFQTRSMVDKLRLYMNGQEVKLSTNIVQNCPGCLAGQPGSLDFMFIPNVGTIGSALSYVKSGDARTILNSDSDPSNDNGGPNGSLLQETLFHSQPMQLAPGLYTLQLTGNSAGISFNVNARIRVVGATCSLN